MSNILLTGSTGFLGTALIPKLLAKGDRVLALARNPEKAKAILPAEVEIIEGDITKPGLGVKKAPNIEQVWHLAAVVQLSQRDKEETFKVNLMGTKNTIEFCRDHNISKLVYVGTAYADKRRNPYEESKFQAEGLVLHSGLQTVVFKPSIIVGKGSSFGTLGTVVTILARVHRRAELLRREIEIALRLPLLEPTLRIDGQPAAHLNLIPVGQVASSIARLADGSNGAIWLTNPRPPTVANVFAWIGEILLIRLIAREDFSHSLTEEVVASSMSAFLPYFRGEDENMPSSILPFRTGKAFIQRLVRCILSDKLKSMRSSQ